MKLNLSVNYIVLKRYIRNPSVIYLFFRPRVNLKVLNNKNSTGTSGFSFLFFL